MSTDARAQLKSCRRFLVKIGSRALTTGEGLNYRVIERLCDDLSLLRDEGRDFGLVSSGAIAAGFGLMGINDRQSALSHNQALAAIGQGDLIRAYSNAFRRYGYTAAQVLITRDDLDDRARYLNIRNTMSSLFELGAIPIINENDTVSVDEIKFTDNDMLSAMIAPIVEAQALIILTDTDGVYDADPRQDPGAERIPLIKDLKQKDIKATSGDAGDVGRGGMRSKLQAAYHASRIGIPAVIASAYTPQVIGRAMNGEDVGTLVLPRTSGKIRQKDHWMSFVTRPKGAVRVDDGAAAMITGNGKSLLPCGVIAVDGSFKTGDAVEIVDDRDQVLAVGLCNYCADEVRSIMGANSRDVCNILGHECDEEIVHRNNMMLKKEKG